MGLGSIIKSAVGGVDSALGGFGAETIGGAASAYGAYQQQQASKDMAKKQMKFQERMSSTAHQRQVADLKAAGLNPILSANKGASSPGGAMATPQNIAGSGVASALNLAQGRANINLTENTALKTRADTNTVEYLKSMEESMGGPLDEETVNKIAGTLGVLGPAAKALWEVYKTIRKGRPSNVKWNSPKENRADWKEGNANIKTLPSRRTQALKPRKPAPTRKTKPSNNSRK